jgi:hypothetical protein
MKKIILIVGKAQGCVNPAVVNNCNKTQEFEADKLASWDERIANIQGPDRGKGESAFDKWNPQ